MEEQIVRTYYAHLTCLKPENLSLISKTDKAKHNTSPITNNL